MKIGVGRLGHVVIDDDIDSRDINSSSKEIGSHHDSLLEFFKFFVLGNSKEMR